MESTSTIKLFLGLLTTWTLLNIVAGAARIRRNNARSKRHNYGSRYERESQCDGLPFERQSPIDIKTSEAKCSNLDRILVPETACDGVHLVNNGGHTAQLELEKCNFKIRNGPLVGQYNVLQAIFHWEEDWTNGSKHTIDGQRYPMEMHVVTKMKWGTSSCAELAVLGFFVEISNTDNSAWNDIIMGLGRITMQGERTTIGSINLRDLLPSDMSEFYSYFGSMTASPYSQIINWTVFKNPIKISEYQIAQFRTLLNGDEWNLVDNLRSAQPLNGRTVYKSCW